MINDDVEKIRDKEISAEPTQDELVNNLFNDFMEEQQPDQDERPVSMAHAS